MSEPIFPSIAILGIGLIGGSIARAAVDTGAAGKVHLFDLEAEVRSRASELGLGAVADTAATAVADADCVILCVPSGAIGAAAEMVAPALRPGAILTDVASVKAEVAGAMAAAAPDGVHVIPGHPIAGTEQSGPDAGFASLFQRAWHILCPMEDQGEGYEAAVARLANFWEALGSRVN